MSFNWSETLVQFRSYALHHLSALALFKTSVQAGHGWPMFVEKHLIFVG